VTERPILFSGAMVRALLKGRKTQTRRVIKPQPKTGCQIAGVIFNGHESCLYGVPGDRLWVRETWASPEENKAKSGRVAYNADGVCGCWIGGGEDRDFVYHGRILQAEGYRECFPENGSTTFGLGKYSDIRSGEFPSYKYGWRPSIFMPRWASRITLEIISVRAERLQDIREEDALAEGCTKESSNGTAFGPGHFTARLDFMMLWDSINAKRGCPWDANPWVWRIEVRRAK
jgi:hypothetical protein